MNRKQEQLIRDKIAIWSKHQELDKFNYNDAMVKFFGSLALLIALVQIVINFFKTSQIGIILLSIIFLIGAILFFIHKYEMNRANAHFIRREHQIDDWYKWLGVDKDELNKEFVKGYCKPCWFF